MKRKARSRTLPEPYRPLQVLWIGIMIAILTAAIVFAPPPNLMVWCCLLLLVVMGVFYWLSLSGWNAGDETRTRLETRFRLPLLIGIIVLAVPCLFLLFSFWFVWQIALTFGVVADCGVIAFLWGIRDFQKARQRRSKRR
jgi:hypothetical protein